MMLFFYYTIYIIYLYLYLIFNYFDLIFVGYMIDEPDSELSSDIMMNYDMMIENDAAIAAVVGPTNITKDGKNKYTLYYIYCYKLMSKLFITTIDCCIFSLYVNDFNYFKLNRFD